MNGWWFTSKSWSGRIVREMATGYWLVYVDDGGGDAVHGYRIVSASDMHRYCWELFETDPNTRAV
jgi:hypothetical protein